MSIPTMSKEEIFSYKDINSIKEERNLSDSDFDSLILTWREEAIGFAQGKILVNFYDRIEENTWKNIIKLYSTWNSFSQVYSEVGQILAQRSYEALISLLDSLNNNYKLQAKHEVLPNYGKNIRFVNKK